MKFYTTYPSPLGQLTLAGDGDYLTGLWIEGQKYFGSTLPETAERLDDLAVFEQTKEWLDRYFSGRRPLPAELPLKPEGSEFRRLVWELLCHIPYGKTAAYKTIAEEAAERMGRKSMSSQAVGGAVGHNPISIIIPCHRVVGTDGSLTGYAGGAEKKLWLLKWEGADVSGLFFPGKP